MKNRVAWGLAVGLAVMLVVGGVVGISHSHGTFRAGPVTVTVIPLGYWRYWRYWHFGHEPIMLGHSPEVYGECVNLGPLEVELYNR